MVRRRFELGVTQTQAAQAMGVDLRSLRYWEADQRPPADRSYPALIGFLGYEPWPEPYSLAERLVAERRRRGLSADRAAAVIDVDPEVLRRWESGEWRPSHLTAERLSIFLRSAADASGT